MYVCIYVGDWRREGGKEGKERKGRIPMKGREERKGLEGIEVECRGG